MLNRSCLPRHRRPEAYPLHAKPYANLCCAHGPNCTKPLAALREKQNSREIPPQSPLAASTHEQWDQRKRERSRLQTAHGTVHREIEDSKFPPNAEGRSYSHPPERASIQSANPMVELLTACPRWDCTTNSWLQPPHDRVAQQKCAGHSRRRLPNYRHCYPQAPVLQMPNHHWQVCKEKKGVTIDFRPIPEPSLVGSATPQSSLLTHRLEQRPKRYW